MLRYENHTFHIYSDLCENVHLLIYRFYVPVKHNNVSWYPYDDTQLHSYLCDTGIKHIHCFMSICL